jgi:tRNA wybutosine-synthesizing protein 4
MSDQNGDTTAKADDIAPTIRQVVDTDSIVSPINGTLPHSDSPVSNAPGTSTVEQRRVVSDNNRSNQKIRLSDKMFEGSDSSPSPKPKLNLNPNPETPTPAAAVVRRATMPASQRPPRSKRDVPPIPKNDPAKQHRDGLVMDTNKSSIVSKRSVEKLYYADQAEFFRYFVSKYKRRSPLINRGYWLRMKAIEHAVARFLAAATTKRKIVINLGCG